MAESKIVYIANREGYIKMNYIFLTYVNRSGSTFLANQLSKSNEICVCPEAHILVELFLIKPNKKLNNKVLQRIQSLVIEKQEFSSWGLDVKFLESLRFLDTYFDCFKYILNYYKNKHKPASTIILFKSERLIELYSSLTNLNSFNNKICWIALIRDVRAVYNSQHSTFWPGRQEKMSCNPIRTALYWNKHVNQYIDLAISKSFISIKYEVLISKPICTIAKITNLLGIKDIAVNSMQGDLYNRLSENNKSLHQNINSSPLQEKISAWKKTLNPNEIQLIEKVSKSNLLELDYELEFEKTMLAIAIQAKLYQLFDTFRIILKKTRYKIRMLIKDY